MVTATSADTRAEHFDASRGFIGHTPVILYAALTRILEESSAPEVIVHALVARLEAGVAVGTASLRCVSSAGITTRYSSNKLSTNPYSSGLRLSALTSQR